MFQLELNDIIKRKDYLAAATLADERLNDRPLGWQLLKDGWRQHCRGAECFRRLYEQYGSTGEHQKMESDLVSLLSLPSLLKTQLSEGVSICGEIAVKYPFEPIREQARRQTFQIASSILESEFSSAPQAALLAVQNLAKEDELLVRDVSRFTNLQRSKNDRRKPDGKANRKAPSDAAKLATIQVFPRIRLCAEGLPTNATWTSAVASSDCLFCLGDANDHRVYVGRWPLSTLQPSALPSGTCVQLESSDGMQGYAVRPQLLANPRRPERVSLQFLPISSDMAGVFVQHIARANSFVDAQKPAGSWIFDVRISNDGRSYALVINNGIAQLVMTGRAGIPSLSFSLAIPAAAIEALMMLGGMVVLQDRQLLLIAGAEVFHTQLPSTEMLDIGPATSLPMEAICELDSPAVSICPAGQFTQPRVLIATESSCYAVWPATRDACRVASDMEKPVIGVTANGIFLIAADDEISAYQLNNQRTIRFARVSLPTSTFVALVSDKSPGSILAVRNDHTVIRLSVPAP